MMKATGSKVPRALQVGSEVKIVDNSGAKKIKIVGVLHYRGRHRRLPKAGVGDVVIGTVKEGNPDIRHTLVKAIIIRQKKPIRRPDGRRLCFEDNAAVVVKDLEKGEFAGTIIKGPVAREAAKRFPKITRISTMVI